jgi:UDP-glucose 4-epimerase
MTVELAAAVAHMVHALLEAGEQVVVLDNLTTGFEGGAAGRDVHRRRCR